MKKTPAKGEVTVYKYGKKMSGHLLDGQEWQEFPVSRCMVEATP